MSQTYKFLLKQRNALNRKIEKKELELSVLKEEAATINLALDEIRKLPIRRDDDDK